MVHVQSMPGYKAQLVQFTDQKKHLKNDKNLSFFS